MKLNEMTHPIVLSVVEIGQFLSRPADPDRKAGQVGAGQLIHHVVRVFGYEIEYARNPIVRVAGMEKECCIRIGLVNFF